MKLFIFFLLSWLTIYAPIFSEDRCPDFGEPDYSLAKFEVIDLSMDLVEVRVLAHNQKELEFLEKIEDLESSNYEKSSKGEVKTPEQKKKDLHECLKTNFQKNHFFIGSTLMEFVDGSFLLTEGVFVFQLINQYYPRLSSGETLFKILSNDSKEITFIIQIPDRKDGINEQPVLTQLFPSGGILGESIVAKGKHFGKSLDRTFFYFYEPFKDETYLLQNRILGPIYPYMLTHDEKGEEEIRFTIPYYILTNRDGTTELTWKEKIFGKTLYISLSRDYRISNRIKLTVLPTYWKWVVGFLSLLVTLIFIGTIAIKLQTTNFIAKVIYDKKTNMYSLANFQSFLWTIVLLGSYFYVAIATGIISEESPLPDFNFSLIALLGISFAGLVGSEIIDKKISPEEKKEGEPQWQDLICSPDGIVDLPKLQLLGFTLVAIIIYIYYLFKSNVLNGLPGIPETLHTLLVTSQGGYLGGKVVAVKKETSNEPEIQEEVQVEESEISKEPEPVVSPKAGKQKISGKK